jgi:hypothetical protein
MHLKPGASCTFLVSCSLPFLFSLLLALCELNEERMKVERELSEEKRLAAKFRQNFLCAKKKESSLAE